MGRTQPGQGRAPRGAQGRTGRPALPSDESQPWQGLYNRQVDLAIEQLFC
jgi:hypothetical protein